MKKKIKKKRKEKKKRQYNNGSYVNVSGVGGDGCPLLQVEVSGRHERARQKQSPVY